MKKQADQNKLRRLQNSIRARKGLIGCGSEFSVALHNCGKMLYTGTDRWGQEEARSWTGVMSLVCGSDYVLALLEDGTLRMAGNPPVNPAYIQMHSCIRTVSVGGAHLAFLLGNGQTVALGHNECGQCNTSQWPEVTDVVCGRNFTAGVTLSGQILVAGGSRAFRYVVRSWQNVAGIFTDEGGAHLYALTVDGTVLSTGRLPRKAAKWKNLVYLAAGGRSIWAITANGTLLSTRRGGAGLSERKQYVACAVGATHALVLTRDGQVLVVGNNDFGQCNTTRFGTLFADFDEFRADRRARGTHMVEQERQYQIRLADAIRYKSRLACGKRITVCINAEGKVLTTAEFPEAKNWNRVRAVACGNAHVLALHDNGCVSSDGNNVDGCTDVSSWQHIKAVAAGKYHSLGLTDSGAVLFAGRNDCGQGDVSHWDRVNRIATTDTYTVGVTFDGRILLAGSPPFDPAVVDETWNGATAMVAAPTHLVCLYEDGTVKSTSHTMHIEGWSGVRAIAASSELTMGLCYGGRVVTTGRNDRGQCHTGNWQRVVDIGCGDGYAAALTADGRILVVGDSLAARESGKSLSCTEATGRWQGVVAFACGPNHLVALGENGQILACGYDEDGQCTVANRFVIFRDVRQLYGYGQYARHLEQEIQAHQVSVIRLEEETKPRARLNLPYAEAAREMRGKFAVGMGHAVILDGEGNVTVSGANDCGQQDLMTYESAVFVAAGPYRSAAILSDGRAVMAGRNSDGQGDAQGLNRWVDGMMDGDGHPLRWKQISCGHSHTAALRSDGRVFTVGANPDGRGDTALWRDAREVACGIRHTVARKADGTCLAVGDNRYGQCNLESWQDTVMIAAGEFHTVALLANGRVVSAGDNRKGQCNLEDLSDVIGVACLPEATLCVTGDGRVVMRGGSGELNAAVEALRDVVALETCEHRVAAMTANMELILLPK